MEKIRIGVIGYGNMGTGHVSYLFDGQVENAVLTAVCDINPEKLKLAENKCGDKIKYFEDYKEMYKSGEVDLVIIAVPHYLHPVMAIDAFNSKIHVLSEKPIGVYTKNIEELNKTAEASGLTFGIMFQQRTHPAHIKIKQMIDDGVLGDLKRVVWIITNWYRSQAYYNSGGWRATWSGEGGGVLINQCPHNIDLWQWFFGLPERMRAFCYFGKYHDIEVEDDVTAYMEYKNGATGVLMTTTGEAPGTNRLEVSGDNGKLVFENGKIIFYKNEMSEREFNRTTTQGFAQPKCEKIEIEYEKGHDEHKKITQNVVNNILNGEKLIAPGYEGIKGLSLSNAMHLSAWTDGWVDFPVDAELYLKLLNERIASSKEKTGVKDVVTDLAGSSNI